MFDKLNKCGNVITISVKIQNISITSKFPCPLVLTVPNAIEPIALVSIIIDEFFLFLNFIQM